MITHSCSKSPFTQFEIHKVNSPDKIRHIDSPTTSILKTPTAIFVTTRSSYTRRLKFANGPVDLQSLKSESRNGDTNGNSEEFTSNKTNCNGETVLDDHLVEVAISPVKTMQVSPESWKAFLEYKKYNDYANETEKTDYTYSRLSKFRHKEIIPGFLIRPNLSRSSISSRRSSLLSLPSNQSSFNESFLSYDFNVNTPSKSEITYDFKTPNKTNKSLRSKYFLRSGNFGNTEIEGDIRKAHLVENDYLSDSGPYKFFKKTTYPTSEASAIDSKTSDYLTKARSLYLDDTDLDEVDDTPVDYEKHFYNSRWCRSRPPQGSGYFGTVLSTIFFYLTTVGTSTKNIILKYILRKKENNIYEDTGYVSASRSTASWTNEMPYSPFRHYSGPYYGSQKTRYQKFTSYFYDTFSRFSYLLENSRITYDATRHHQMSNKHRFWWILIPFLLLAAFWLFKAEQNHGLISNRYKIMDCQSNGFLTAMENTFKPAWKSCYVTYKKASASVSCYISDSWERLKLPFTLGYERLCSELSSVSNALLTREAWSALCQGFWSLLKLPCDAFLNMHLFLYEFFTDLISAGINMLHYVCEYFTDVFYFISDGLTWIANIIMGILNGLVLNLKSYLNLPPEKAEKTVKMTEPVGTACHEQQENIDKLSRKLEDLKSFSWDLSALKRKIDELELEFKREMESIKSRSQFYDKRLEDNYLTLQKYQAVVNHAVTSSKRPGPVSSSTLQYFLDNHSNELKQWILQNFMLKTDSANFDENKVALLIAKYSNKSGEELFSLKEEFKKFIINHRSEMESLRKEIDALATRDFGKGSEISVGYIKKLVGDAIKLYDADKTGRVDYALETAGGQVQSIRCTETYIASPKSYILLGWAVYTKTSSPRDAITPGMAAGQCWAFVGSQGFLVIQLSHTIQVTGFTMEHISKSLVPKGHIESAPKNFSIWGLKHEYDVDPYLFGEYVYLDNDETLQYFPVSNPTTVPYNMVELKITSNHGNPNYTCLYRIRVHGELQPTIL